MAKYIYRCRTCGYEWESNSDELEECPDCGDWHIDIIDRVKEVKQ